MKGPDTGSLPEVVIHFRVIKCSEVVRYDMIRLRIINSKLTLFTIVVNSKYIQVSSKVKELLQSTESKVK